MGFTASRGSWGGRAGSSQGGKEPTAQLEGTSKPCASSGSRGGARAISAGQAGSMFTMFHDILNAGAEPCSGSQSLVAAGRSLKTGSSKPAGG